jgi:hypothetical protein
VAERQKKASRKAGDGLEDDFGPGFDPTPGAPEGDGGGRPSDRDESPRAASFAAGFAGIPCGKDGCFLKPVGDLVTRFAFELAKRGHADSTRRAATSGVELLRALRDFLDEEIAFAEHAAQKQRDSARYTKIPVE